MTADSVASAHRIYAIGDIHGRLDLLEQIIELIRLDMDEHSGTGLTVTLGDYVDRGPESRGVVERLSSNPFVTPYIALKGNHEVLFETFVADPNTGPQWRSLGGLETLHSYGIPVAPLLVGRGYDAAAEQLRTVLPPVHSKFLASLKLSFDAGHYFLCHAGIRPNVSFERQSAQDLLWIREDFLNSQVNFGKIVVHGHTPNEEPEVLPNRINVDTGAFATGRLTCVVLEAESHRFLYANQRSTSLRDVQINQV